MSGIVITRFGFATNVPATSRILMNYCLQLNTFQINAVIFTITKAMNTSTYKIPSKEWLSAILIAPVLLL